MRKFHFKNEHPGTYIYQKSLFNMVFIFLGEFITKLYESSIFIG